MEPGGDRGVGVEGGEGGGVVGEGYDGWGWGAGVEPEDVAAAAGQGAGGLAGGDFGVCVVVEGEEGGDGAGVGCGFDFVGELLGGGGWGSCLRRNDGIGRRGGGMGGLGCEMRG